MKLSLVHLFTIAVFTCSQLLANVPAEENGETAATETEAVDPTELINLYTTAIEAIKNEEWKTASDNLKAVYAKSPNTPLAYLGFGKFHYAREEYASSAKALYKGLEIAPMNTELLYEYSRTLVMIGDLAGAIVQAEKATYNSNAKWQHFYWLHILLKNNGEKTIAKMTLEMALDQLDYDIRALNSTELNERQQEALANLKEQKKRLSDELFLLE